MKTMLVALFVVFTFTAGLAFGQTNKIDNPNNLDRTVVQPKNCENHCIVVVNNTRDPKAAIEAASRANFTLISPEQFTKLRDWNGNLITKEAWAKKKAHPFWFLRLHDLVTKPDLAATTKFYSEKAVAVSEALPPAQPQRPTTAHKVTAAKVMTVQAPATTLPAQTKPVQAAETPLTLAQICASPKLQALCKSLQDQRDRSDRADQRLKVLQAQFKQFKFIVYIAGAVALLAICFIALIISILWTCTNRAVVIPTSPEPDPPPSRETSAKQLTNALQDLTNIIVPAKGGGGEVKEVSSIAAIEVKYNELAFLSQDSSAPLQNNTEGIACPKKMDDNTKPSALMTIIRNRLAQGLTASVKPITVLDAGAHNCTCMQGQVILVYCLRSDTDQTLTILMTFLNQSVYELALVKCGESVDRQGRTWSVFRVGCRHITNWHPDNPKPMPSKVLAATTSRIA